MRAVLVYTVLWSGTAAITWRCWTKWRRGADRLWAERWGVLSWTLFLLAFAVLMTLALFDATSLLTGVLSVPLLLASGACQIAKGGAARRADAATRAMCTGLGLPVARRLWSPTAVGALWFGAAFLCLMAWPTVTITRAAAHDRQQTPDERGGPRWTRPSSIR
ncbi:hypothetical protein [Streptomyces sp. HUAS TT7]|uniref:hypothetical protein n=1 Tax=Streptomyces sp. HUAS TT7 TaxID=3447507 RepID=UPI003F66097A